MTGSGYVWLVGEREMSGKALSEAPDGTYAYLSITETEAEEKKPFVSVVLLTLTREV